MNLLDPSGIARRHAYVIVCGNEKGGSGKTTTAMHLIVALLNAGYRVASIDLDSRQRSLSRYVKIALPGAAGAACGSGCRPMRTSSVPSATA